LVIIYLFIETSFAWVTKLSVNTVFQFGPGVKHNTPKIEQYNNNTVKTYKYIVTRKTRPARWFIKILKHGKYRNSYCTIKTIGGTQSLTSIFEKTYCWRQRGFSNGGKSVEGNSTSCGKFSFSRGATIRWGGGQDYPGKQI
jgi:hypothetical protein